MKKIIRGLVKRGFRMYKPAKFPILERGFSPGIRLEIVFHPVKWS